MPRDANEIKQILENGASIAVSARDYDGFTLVEFAKLANESGATLTIYNSSQIDNFYMVTIAKEGKRNVVFR